MNVQESFSAFWAQSSFKKIKKAECLKVWIDIVASKGIQEGQELESFTNKVIESANARLSFIRTANGSLEGEQHPYTWLINRDFENPHDAPLSKRQRPNSRQASSLRRRLKAKKAELCKASKVNPMDSKQAEQRRLKKVQSLVNCVQELEKQIQMLTEKQSESS